LRPPKLPVDFVHRDDPSFLFTRPFLFFRKPQFCVYSCTSGMEVVIMT
jgi:hypothetical protein